MFTKKDKKIVEQKLDARASLQYKCYDLSYGCLKKKPVVLNS
jgi:hypothetical protein